MNKKNKNSHIYNDNMATDAVTSLYQKANLNMNNSRAKKSFDTLPDMKNKDSHNTSKPNLDLCTGNMISNNSIQSKKYTNTTNDDFFSSIQAERLRLYDTSLDYKNLPYSKKYVTHKNSEYSAFAKTPQSENDNNDKYFDDSYHIDIDKRINALYNYHTLNSSSKQTSVENLEHALLVGENTTKPKRNIKKSSLQKKTIATIRILSLFFIIALSGLTSYFASKTFSLKKELVNFEDTIKSLELANNANLKLTLRIEALEEELLSLMNVDIDNNEEITEIPEIEHSIDDNIDDVNDTVVEVPKFIFPINYVVQSGDTLVKISEKFYDDPNKYQKIYDTNNLATYTLLVGQKLTIPAQD